MIKFKDTRDSGNYFMSILRGLKEREYFMAAFLGNGSGRRHYDIIRIVSEGRKWRRNELSIKI